MPAVNEADPRVKRTRKLLQDALLELLAEKSFDAITVQDIAERSTINRATFYAHFVDKYELFASYNREWFRQALFNRLPEVAPFSRANLEVIIGARGSMSIGRSLFICGRWPAILIACLSVSCGPAAAPPVTPAPAPATSAPAAAKPTVAAIAAAPAKPAAAVSVKGAYAQAS